MPTRSTTTRADAADTGVPVTQRPTYRDRIRLLELRAIAPPRVPLRATLDQEVVHDIARTVQEDGLYQLPGVRQIGRKRYELLWGQTRLAAVRAAGWTQIEVVVVDDVDDRRALRLGLNENLQRRELTPADKLRIIAALAAQGLNGKEIAATTAISASDVSRLPRIAARPLLWEAIAAGTLTIRAAQELLQLPDAALTPLRATIAARHAAGDELAIVAELRPLAEAARAADDATGLPPRRVPRAPITPLVRIARGITSLIGADDDRIWDDDTLSQAAALSTRLAQVVAQQRARR